MIACTLLLPMVHVCVHVYSSSLHLETFIICLLFLYYYKRGKMVKRNLTRGLFVIEHKGQKSQKVHDFMVIGKCVYQSETN